MSICEMNLFIGYEGVFSGAAIFAMMWLLILTVCKGSSFHFDAQGEKGAFEKLLSTYIDLTKFVLGLAAGAIVLLAGSSSFHLSGHLPSSFASPLYLLAMSIIYGILFMLFLTVNYEAYRHQTAPYSRFKYTRNQALGYSSIFCSLLGYVWLIAIVTK